MVRFVYNLLFPLGLVIFLPRFVGKMVRRGNYRHKFGQRLGLYDADTRRRLGARPRTWIHAVSVGEVAIALRLIGRMREIEPDFRCALTTTTTTGFTFASSAGQPWIEVMYSPLDWWPIMRRAFAAISPARLVLVEAEVWPNMVAIAKARGVPVALVNARLSQRSEGRFRRFRAIVAPIFRQLDLVCVQERKDIERWTALGVHGARIRHVGSVKFDPTQSSPAPSAATTDAPADLLHRLGVATGAPVLLGGSTHDGEEAILAGVFLELRTDFPGLFFVIAPRHAERAAAVEAQLRSFGLHPVRRTAMDRQQPGNADCVLIDTTGELPAWYDVATVVFVGKSITTRGGQNPVEPINAGKPVMFGPHMENFQPLAAALVRAAGAIEVNDAASLIAAVSSLLRDPARRAQMVQNARSILAEHEGATARTAALIAKLEAATPGKPLAT